MSTVSQRDNADTLIAQWRTNASEDNPAGPLFAGGEYVEADIIGDIVHYTGQCGTGCSASRTHYCC